MLPGVRELIIRNARLYKAEQLNKKNARRRAEYARNKRRKV